jgi:hypothetical protein
VASKATPAYFRTYCDEARKAAADAGLAAPYFKPRERADADLVLTHAWRSQDIAVPLADVAGNWSVFLSYEFQTLAGDRQMHLVSTCFGLNAVGVPFASDARVTVLRYDYDALLDSYDENGQHPNVAVHINVLQPDPLGDHLHLPGFRDERWAVGEIMRWFTSPRLLADLKRRLPP